MHIVTQRIDARQPDWRVWTPTAGTVTVSTRGVDHAESGAVETMPRRGFRDVQVFGLRRSGNHALISFILDRCSGPRIHANNAVIDTQGFLRTACGHLVRRSGDPSQQGCRLISLEDHPLNIVATRLPQAQRLLVLRDPYNTFASRLQMVRNRPGTSHAVACRVDGSIVELWKQYAREFLGETNLLGRHVLCVNFNRWFSDDAYRSSLAEQFGDSETGWPSVSKFSQGSSFDGFRFADSPQDMDVLNRWRKYAHEDSFQRLFDDELIELATEIFGDARVPWRTNVAAS